MDLITMADASRWESPGDLGAFLAHQLRSGCLCFVLGAGVSFEIGLPQWSDLVDRCYRQLGKRRKDSASLDQAAEALFLQHTNRNELHFASLVRQSLYEDFADPIQRALRSRNFLSLMNAISKMCSIGHAQIITFNFDDILELSLEHFGISTTQVTGQAEWFRTSRAIIYHPHGLLPYAKSDPVTSIVMTQRQYDVFREGARAMWHPVLSSVLKSHTCIFVGLSGSDKNLRELLASAQTSHASRAHDHPYWGISFYKSKSTFNYDMWKDRGVLPVKVSKWTDISDWIYRVCQG